MSSLARLRVAIVGCGIGGPATALFLARAGHEVVIFDKSPELGPAGAGILLAPTGQFVLDKLGLLQAALDHGSKVQRIEGLTTTGRKILDLRYRNLGTGLFGLGIHRGSLFEILRDALVEEGIPVYTGRKVAGLDNEFVLFDDGRKQGPFDVIVLADGAHSDLRRSLSVETLCTEYEYGALWVSATNWGDLPDNVLRQTYKGTRKMAGILPSGRMPDSSGRQISLFWSIRTGDVDAWRDAGLDAWKREVLEFIPVAAPILEQITDTEQVTVARYYDLRTSGLIKESYALVGDSGHATSPQLGQGASLALFDAYCLAQCLIRERFIMPALVDYQDQRIRHARFYQRASKWMTPFFQSGHTYLSWSRDVLLGPLSRLPWFQQQMVATMCGLKQGPFESIPQAPEIMRMGVKFAFGKMVQEESESTSVVRW